MTGVQPANSRLRLLLGAVFISRLLFALLIWSVSGPSGFFNPDTGSYVQLAKSLLHGSFGDGTPEIFRTPGYPLFLAPAVALQHPMLIGLLQNVLLSVVSAWLIWKIAGEISGDSKAASWAVLLYCFEPVGFVYSEKLLTETPFTAALLLFVWVFVRYLKDRTDSKLSLSAFALGGATYVRPVTLYLVLLLIVFLALFPRQLTWQKRLKSAVLFPAVFALALAPWTIRNIVVADYKGFSSAGDVNLYFMSATAVQAKLEHKSFAEVLSQRGYANDSDYYQAHPEQRSWSQGQIARYWSREAKALLSRHSGLYLGIHARGCMTTLLDPSATEILKPLRLYPAYGGLMSYSLDHGLFQAVLRLIREYPVTAALLPLLILQLIFYYVLGAAALRWLPFDVRVFFLTLTGYFVLVSGVPGVTARYRAPIMPIVCISAGVAISQWRKQSNKHSAVRLNRSSPCQDPC